MAKKPSEPAPPTFFESPRAFRAWLVKNHQKSASLLVGFHKVHRAREGVQTLSWPESVAEVLCFGWIDGVRKSLGPDAYTIRFTPRRPKSNWSAINIRLFAELEEKGLMMAPGRLAFDARPHKTGPKAKGYTYQRREAEFDATCTREFKKHKTAWEFFLAQAPSYRGLVTWWVMQAKKDETKQRRLAKLIAFSSNGKRL